MLFDENDHTTEQLYHKYMAFNKIMLEENEPLELASILVIQGLSFYKTVMDPEDYQKIVKSIYDQRNSVKTLD